MIDEGRRLLLLKQDNGSGRLHNAGQLLLPYPMADHLPPPSYSQQDPVITPRRAGEHSANASVEPQIVLLPTTVDAVNFQTGYLGAEEERAAIEGEIQVKGFVPLRCLLQDSPWRKSALASK